MLSESKRDHTIWGPKMCFAGFKAVGFLKNHGEGEEASHQSAEEIFLVVLLRLIIRGRDVALLF